ncbi:MAG: nickel insertion protein, partial [Anaerolineae bacterium]
MKLAYFDCFAGISGDMILGALIDAGLDLGEFQNALRGLRLSGYELQVEKAQKGVIQATDVQVQVSDGSTSRTLADIEAVITESELPERVRRRSISIFQ